MFVITLLLKTATAQLDLGGHSQNVRPSISPLPLVAKEGEGMVVKKEKITLKTIIGYGFFKHCQWDLASD